MSAYENLTNNKPKHIFIKMGMYLIILLISVFMPFYAVADPDFSRAFKYLGYGYIEGFVSISVSWCTRSGYPGYSSGYSFKEYCWVKNPPAVLRENLGTGEVVVIREASEEWIDGFDDDCVPPGEYRYGFAELPGCPGEYYIEVTIALSIKELYERYPACKNKIPKYRKYEGTPPWHGATTNWFECEEEGGCSISEAGRAVLALQAVGMLLGLLLWRRSRAGRRRTGQ